MSNITIKPRVYSIGNTYFNHIYTNDVLTEIHKCVKENGKLITQKYISYAEARKIFNQELDK